MIAELRKELMVELREVPIVTYFKLLWVYLRLFSCSCMDLLFPRFCPGCGAWDEDVCDRCSARLFGSWMSIAGRLPYLLAVSRDDGECRPIIPCCALSSYSGCVRTLIISWKHSNSARRDRQICRLWARGVKQLGLGNLCTNILANCSGVERILIIPAPSRWRRRHRGQLVAEKLARAVEGECGGYAELRDVMRMRSDLRVVSSCGGVAKWIMNHRCSVKQGGGFQVANHAQRGRKRERVFCDVSLDGCAVILVDDVVTTGATAQGMVRAVEESGGRVLGMLALAAAGNQCSQSENIVA